MARLPAAAAPWLSRRRAFADLRLPRRWRPGLRPWQRAGCGAWLLREAMNMAGWFADPWHEADLRFHDGPAWTPRTRTLKPCTVRYTRADHGLHAVMTVATLGLWAPVWAYAGGGRYRIR